MATITDRTPRPAKPRRSPDAGASGAAGTTLLLAAGAGLAAGLSANLLRKAAVQAPTVLAGNWSDALAAEHKATLLLFDAVEKTHDSATKKRSFLLMQLKHALGKHALQEENAVYAALRNDGAAAEADRLNGEHGYVKQYLYDLDMLPKGDPAWLPKVREFRVLLEKHMAEEEEHIFPRLRVRLSDEENKALTFAMNKEGFKLA